MNNLEKACLDATRGVLLYNQLSQLIGYSKVLPWEKIQSGNPGGLSKASRRKLTDAFIRILAKDWKAHCEKAIQRCKTRMHCFTSRGAEPVPQVPELGCADRANTF
jgi:hypothetical protein